MPLLWEKLFNVHIAVYINISRKITFFSDAFLINRFVSKRRYIWYRYFEEKHVFWDISVNIRKRSFVWDNMLKIFFLSISRKITLFWKHFLKNRFLPIPPLKPIFWGKVLVRDNFLKIVFCPYCVKYQLFKENNAILKTLENPFFSILS